MTSRPSVSAIITAFNSGAYIRDAIESVLGQTRKVDEILVVDDGSTDETPSIVAAYASAGVNYVRQENQGPGAARNLGLRSTDGDIVAFLDADDIWMERKTEIQYDYLSSHPDIGVVSGHKMLWKTDKGGGARRIQRYGNIPDVQVPRELLINNIIGNPSMTLIRRTLLDKVGRYNPNLRWGQDWELWIRISASTIFGFVDEPVILYRIHEHNHSSENLVTRLDCLLGISQNAIRSATPAWLRNILFMRAKSQYYYFRSLYEIRKPFSKKRQIGYALASFLIYPWDRPGVKFRTVVRTLVGDTFYQNYKSRLRSQSSSLEE